jgi:hypothetical protein
MTPDSPACSKLLYWLCYLCHFIWVHTFTKLIVQISFVAILKFLYIIPLLCSQCTVSWTHCIYALNCAMTNSVLTSLECVIVQYGTCTRAPNSEIWCSWLRTIHTPRCEHFFHAYYFMGLGTIYEETFRNWHTLSVEEVGTEETAWF